jgi:indolepyruvate ferredoxin oxidoreductase
VERRAPSLKPAVEEYLFKLMAYKDEYEVARLLTKPHWERRIREQWEAVESVSYNIHPPVLRALGFKKKLSVGEWFRYPLKALAALRVVRGTLFDVFGYLPHRREERALIGWYRQLVEQVIARLTPENEALAIEIVTLPGEIRGYEQIKSDSIRKVRQVAEEKVRQFTSAGEGLQPTSSPYSARSASTGSTRAARRDGT